MTAEIAVMNKAAVALAADSAVTISTADGAKIYNTVNKLFALSKHEPVGFMIYGNAHFNGVPWETIVKTYRKSLGRKKFGTLRGYSEDFLGYLCRAPSMFAPGESQLFDSIVAPVLTRLQQDIEELAAQRKQEQTPSLAIEVLVEIEKHVRKLKRFDKIPTGYGSRALRRFDKNFRQLREECLAGVSRNKRFEDRLNRFLKLIIERQPLFQGNVSGIVFAGFGTKEHFPCLIAFEVDGYLFKHLRVVRSARATIEPDNTAVVMPFAQSEMVFTFMEGIDPTLKSLLDSYLGKMFSGMPQAMVAVLKGEKHPLSKILQRKLRKISDEIHADFTRRFDDHRRDRHWRPIVSAVSVLPKEELASMAEALVNLTSFKRRISLDAETVGGPIDVAVISKGDGFIWIKRKHYFDPAMNPQFFANYNSPLKNAD